MKVNRIKISGKPKGRRNEKFWSGSGKFFLVLVFIYLIYYGASQVADLASQRNDQYRRTDIEIVGNRLVSNSNILSICGFKSKEDNAIEINIDSLAAQLMTLN